MMVDHNRCNGTTSSVSNEGALYGMEAKAKVVDTKAKVPQAYDSRVPRVLKAMRLLIADLCQQFNGGHPGGAIGMAAIGVALWRYVMRYAPHTPTFFNRDRFVLSNGHACLLQYTLLHLTGYKAMTLDQLKSYHSTKAGTLCPGHPEIEHEGIEVTTGPLGQGVANAVGMAAASRHIGSTFNREGFPIASNHTWCMVGDACLQEGVALEAISLAGHWKLGNLTIIYDNNQITCDGNVNITNTEDVNLKMKACGWEVIDILDGCYDVLALVRAMEQSKESKQPTFINVRTVIGLDSAVEGKAVAHGAAFGAPDIARMKEAYGFDSATHFAIPQDVRAYFSDLPARGEDAVSEWESMFALYKEQHPELGAQLQARLNGETPGDWESLIPSEFPKKPTASRVSSGLVFNPIAERVPSFFVGTADLSPSVNMSWKTKQAFQANGVANGSYSGRYVHYGVREHAMAAIANGIAAYHPNMIIPVTSSFFMFYLYAAPAVRMGALQRLQVIHVATHDTIGMGEDGPTHQPLELASLYRAMPNLLYIRPGDSEEVAGAWTIAIKAKYCPTIISTSRHPIPQLEGLTKRAEVAKGAYVLRENAEAGITLIGVGAELGLAVAVADQLESLGISKVRILSFPCQRLFEKQTLEYRRSILQRRMDRPTIAIEPYVASGWERYANAAVCMSTDRFGQSLPGRTAYEFFGFTVDKIVMKLQNYLQALKTETNLIQEFVEFTESDTNASVVVY